MSNKIKVRLICWTDGKTQILYRYKLMPLCLYNIFREHNHLSYSIATGEHELLEKLIEKHRRN